MAVVLLVLIWSGIGPKDHFTWILEVAPVLIGLPALLFLSRRGVPVTPLLLVLLGIHAVILMVGGRYTYAEVPLGFWMQEKPFSAPRATRGIRNGICFWRWSGAWRVSWRWGTGTTARSDREPKSKYICMVK